jgi:hypothetical protein
VLEPIEEMPPGTLGFRSVGPLQREDYADVLVPALREKIDAGEEIRLLFAAGDDFTETAGALWEDSKTGIELGVGHWKAWKRVAVVTDVDWVARAIKAFGWMSPGDVEVFGEHELDVAKAWVAA